MTQWNMDAEECPMTFSVSDLLRLCGVPPLEFVCTLLYFAYVVYVWYLGTDTYQRAVAYNI